ncbi:hypothetical protein F6V30_14305 [Oryzomonas sagensis]|uniref:Uncharacterized protein n=1 Tax=Oryzomonas sagensis TaxID=2603857 RepID=A0ABQ6TLC0_9BACT|nr:hypothetical protein [Oryzomonas sagensis]KAB0669005.1 hypothetical protein F6V30_14305 [Oryzomonas sagensis]
MSLSKKTKRDLGITVAILAIAAVGILSPLIGRKLMHSTPPEVLAKIELYRGKAFFSLNCRVYNTLYALKHPHSLIQVGYLDLPDGTKAKHLWVVEDGQVVDRVDPANWSRQAFAKCTIQNNFISCTPAAPQNDIEKKDYEWISRYLNSFISSYRAA